MKVDVAFYEIRNIEDDWDGHGAVKPIPAIVDMVESFISKLPADLVSGLEIAPCYNGAIRLGWRNMWKFLELEFESPDHITYFRWYTKDDVEEEGTFNPDDIERALNLIGWVVGRERDK